MEGGEAAWKRKRERKERKNRPASQPTAARPNRGQLDSNVDMKIAYFTLAARKLTVPLTNKVFHYSLTAEPESLGSEHPKITM